MNLEIKQLKDRDRLLPGKPIVEWVTGTVCLILTALFCLFIFRILSDIVYYGAEMISWDFLVTNPSDGGRSGGIFSVLLSTIWVLVIAAGVSTPIAVFAAVWLSEFQRNGSKWSRLIRISLDVLAGIPSVVFGLAGNVFFCQICGLGYSILAGGLTLACMILPLLVRVLENSFRSIPDRYRLAAESLGIGKTTLVFRVLLPQASGGLVTGIVLGVCRAISETAALLFTSGSVDSVPESWLDSGRTLSIHVYELAMNPGGDSAANATALVLIVFVLIFSSAASLLAATWRTK